MENLPISTPVFEDADDKLSRVFREITLCLAPQTRREVLKKVIEEFLLTP
jgi:hypothetical protein